MRCKKGDLAIVVKSDCGNEGRIVRCIRFIGHIRGWRGDDRWEIDQYLPATDGGTGNTMRDSYLVPINNPGDDAQDETLLWKPVPSNEKETA